MAKKSKSKISGVFKKVDNTKLLLQGVEALTNTQVMVGVPGEKRQRQDAGQDGITNAALAYIHDNGSPEAGIPGRPFMRPGIKDVQKQITEEFKNAGKAILNPSNKGGNIRVESYLNRIGIIATRAIKNRIGQGIPPPLAPSTIKGRIARVKGKARRKKIASALASGLPASRQNGADGVFTPLIVTGQLRNAITYVLRKIGTKLKLPKGK
jgi:hypothetical protein